MMASLTTTAAAAVAAGTWKVLELPFSMCNVECAGTASTVTHEAKPSTVPYERPTSLESGMITRLVATCIGGTGSVLDGPHAAHAYTAVGARRSCHCVNKHVSVYRSPLSLINSHYMYSIEH